MKSMVSIISPRFLSINFHLKFKLQFALLSTVGWSLLQLFDCAVQIFQMDFGIAELCYIKQRSIQENVLFLEIKEKQTE